MFGRLRLGATRDMGRGLRAYVTEIVLDPNALASATLAPGEPGHVIGLSICPACGRVSLDQSNGAWRTSECFLDHAATETIRYVAVPRSSFEPGVVPDLWIENEPVFLDPAHGGAPRSAR